MHAALVSEASSTSMTPRDVANSGDTGTSRPTNVTRRLHVEWDSTTGTFKVRGAQRRGGFCGDGERERVGGVVVLQRSAAPACVALPCTVPVIYRHGKAMYKLVSTPLAVAAVLPLAWLRSTPVHIRETRNVDPKTPVWPWPPRTVLCPSASGPRFGRYMPSVCRCVRPGPAGCVGVGAAVVCGARDGTVKVTAIPRRSRQADPEARTCLTCVWRVNA